MQEKQKRYRIYIDESGDHSFKSIEHPSKRYLGLTGCIFELSNSYTLVGQKLEKLKNNYFTHDPDFPVILHREEIIKRIGAFGKLCDENLRSKFDEELLALINIVDFKPITVVIDKKKHIDKHTAQIIHPYHYCLHALLEQYCSFLKSANCKGDIIAESRGGSEDRMLKEAYKNVHEHGTFSCGAEIFQEVLTSKEIKIKAKESNIAGIQLADIIAHSSKQFILIDQKRMENNLRNFDKRLYEILERKYTNDGCDKIFL